MSWLGLKSINSFGNILCKEVPCLTVLGTRELTCSITIKNIKCSSFFDTCNLFYSCHLTFITDEIFVILIIYLYDFIFYLSSNLFEHQNNGTNETVIIPGVRDNGQSLFVLFVASLQQYDYAVTQF